MDGKQQETDNRETVLKFQHTHGSIKAKELFFQRYFPHAMFIKMLNLFQMTFFAQCNQPHGCTAPDYTA